MIFFIAFISLVALKEPHIKKLLVEASKSGPIEYEFVKPVNCKSGKYKDTYVIAQNEKSGIEAKIKRWECWTCLHQMNNSSFDFSIIFCSPVLRLVIL